VTEENETMEFEWETTEQYLEMISKFGSHWSEWSINFLLVMNES
jgi:hypothetical protein